MLSIPYDEKLTILFADRAALPFRTDDARALYETFRLPILTRDLGRLIDASTRFLVEDRLETREAYIGPIMLFKRLAAKDHFSDMDAVDNALLSIHNRFMRGHNTYRPSNISHTLRALAEDYPVPDARDQRYAQWRSIAFDSADLLAAFWTKINSDSGQAELYRAEKRPGGLDALCKRWLNSVMKDDLNILANRLQHLELARVLDIRSAKTPRTITPNKPLALLTYQPTGSAA